MYFSATKAVACRTYSTGKLPRCLFPQQSHNPHSLSPTYFLDVAFDRENTVQPSRNRPQCHTTFPPNKNTAQSAHIVVGEGVAIAEAHATRDLHVEHVCDLVPRVIVINQRLSAITDLQQQKYEHKNVQSSEKTGPQVVREGREGGVGPPDQAKICDGQCVWGEGRGGHSRGQPVEGQSTVAAQTLQ